MSHGAVLYDCPFSMVNVAALSPTFQLVKVFPSNKEIHSAGGWLSAAIQKNRQKLMAKGK
jgi:hypothetical protein